MRKAITLCLLLMLVMPVCFAVDLDASALKPVTIRSEFQRGYDAVWRSTCGNLPTSTIDKIIGDMVTKNKQTNTDTDAFLLGVYYGACERMAYALDDKNIIKEQLTEKSTFKNDYEKFLEKQKAVGLDEQQLSKLSGMKYEFVQNQLEKWALLSK